MIRESCATEISVGDGMASTSSSRAWTRYLAAASRGHRGNPQKHMSYRSSADVNPVDSLVGHSRRRQPRALFDPLSQYPESGLRVTLASVAQGQLQTRVRFSPTSDHGSALPSFATAASASTTGSLKVQRG